MAFPTAAALFAAAVFAAAAAQAQSIETADPSPVLEAYYGDDLDSACAPTSPGVECLAITVDHIARFRLDADIGAMLIGNPSIADVNLITASDVAISARSVGSTNIIFLDDAGELIAEIEIVVSEPDARRIVLRRGAELAETYQCAPRCERTLTQLDDAAAHGELSEVITREGDVAGGAAAE